MIAHIAYPSTDDQSVLIRTKHASMEFDCTPAQYLDGVAKYRQGAMIQDAFYFLSNDEREFLLSGLTPEMWKQTFPMGDEE